LLVLAVAPATQAGIRPVGDPIRAGSWGQRFVYETGGEDMDAFTCETARDVVNVLAVGIVKGGPFESPTLRAFDVPQWRLVSESADVWPHFAVGATYVNPVDRLCFEIWFGSEPEEPVSFVLAAWRPGEVGSLEAFSLSWSGLLGWESSDRGVWVVSAASPMDNPLMAPIPAPAAAALAGVGLGIACLVKRRMG